MGGILVIAEQRDGKIKKVTYEILSCMQEIANKLGIGMDVGLIGDKLDALEAQLAQYGASRVFKAEDAVLSQYNTELYTAAAAAITENSKPSIILAGATVQGKDLMPRLAARLKSGLFSDCTGIEVGADNKLIFRRPVYAGKAIVEGGCNSDYQMATIRPNVFSLREPDTAKKAEVLKIDANLGSIKPKVKLREIIKGQSEKPDLTEASIIVSGGRGMKAKENFKIIEELADVLGAAVGASRAAVDSGYADPSQQVGQTGKTVNPNLYIACGISGAIQHLAGMRTSKVIVAINKDAEAPIFKVADYGIVGDLFQIVPELAKEFKALLSE